MRGKAETDARSPGGHLACTGAGSVNSYFPTIVNRFAGAKFKCIPAYEGAEDQNLALERGKMEARAVSYETTLRSTVGQWRDAGQDALRHPVRLRASGRDQGRAQYHGIRRERGGQAGYAVHPGAAGVRTARSPPPPTPRGPARRAPQRPGDGDQDPAYTADAERQQESVDFLSGEELQKLAGEIMATPPTIIEKAKELMQ